MFCAIFSTMSLEDLKKIDLDAAALADAERVQEGIRRLEASQRVAIDPNLTVNFNLAYEIAVGNMAEPPYMDKHKRS